MKSGRFCLFLGVTLLCAGLFACRPSLSTPEEFYIEAERRWGCGEIDGLFEKFYYPDEATRRYFRIMEAVSSRMKADASEHAKAKLQCERWDKKQKLSETKAEKIGPGEYLLSGKTISGSWARIPGFVVVETDKGYKIRQK